MRNDRSNLTHLFKPQVYRSDLLKKMVCNKKKLRQKDSRVSKNCKSNSRNLARRYQPTQWQGMLEHLSSIDSFARSGNINLTALNFATKKEEDEFGRFKFIARKTELLPKFLPRK